MTDFNQFHDSFSDVPPPPKKLPDMINVLTILTFVGCALALVSAIYSFFTICQSIEIMENSMGKMGENNPMAGMMDSVTLAAQKQCQMKLPIFIINIVSTLLCFVGALQMRKMKKSGFFIYLVGEIGAPVAMLLLIGGGMMGGLMMAGLIIPVIFIVLYATQLKHMK